MVFRIIVAVPVHIYEELKANTNQYNLILKRCLPTDQLFLDGINDFGRRFFDGNITLESIIET